MPDLGKKHSCHSCHTKFYDLGKTNAVCPKCGADSKDSDEDAPPLSRSRRVAKVAPVVPTDDLEESDDLESDARPADGDDDADEDDDEAEVESTADVADFETAEEDY